MDHREEVRFAYNLRKERWGKILGPELGIVKQASKPMSGPWYLLYLQPNWVVKAYPESSEENSIDHIDYWDTLVSDIVTHYGVKNVASIRELKTLCYSMPRGRVVFRKMPNGRSEWVFYHGVDFKYTNAYKKQLIEVFNLTQQARAGFVRFDLDDHENMSPDEHQELMAIINSPRSKIPFDAKQLNKQLTRKVAPQKFDDFDDDEDFGGMMEKVKTLNWKNRTSD